MKPGFLRRETLGQRRTIYALCIGACLVTLAFGLFGRERGPNVGPYLVVAALLWAFCDMLTAFLLFAQCSVSRRLDFGVIASAYLLNALLTFPYIGAYTGVLGTSAPTLGNQQIPAFFFFVWHITFPILVLGAITIRRRGGARPVQYRTLPALVAGTAAVAALIIAFAFGARDMLPHFVVAGVFQPAYWAVGVPTVIVLSSITAIAMIRLRGHVSSLRLYLMFAMFSAALEGLLNLASPIRFSYAWDFSKVLAVLTASIVMLRMLSDIVRMYRDTRDMVNAQSGQAAARIRAIWQIATSEGLSEDDHLQMILDVAIGNILPARAVFATLSHYDDGFVVIDAVSRLGDAQALAPLELSYRPGTRFAIGTDLHAALSAQGKTVGWNPSEAIPSERLTAAGAKLAIGTPIATGTKTHFVVFCSLDAAHDRQLSDMDYAFVDVVAANISQRFHQRSQRDRMQYQSDHDGLTGLHNRSHFVHTVRAELAANTLQAIVVINLDDFGLLNERVGHATCDELLVEISAAMTLVDEDDFIARVAGDEFAVVLRSPNASRSTKERVEAYAAIFGQPFRTGDRTREEFHTVRASFGAADAQEAVLFDDLLLRAHVALEQSQREGGGRVTVYSSQIAASLYQRSMQYDELRRALAEDQFVLLYQPTFELNSRVMAGAEALIRWNHPARGLIGPLEFLDAVRGASLMPELTVWVIRRVIADLGNMPLPLGFRCYFNVPAQVLEDTAFVAVLEEQLRLAPAMASRLGLEVTETDVMNQVERAIESLHGIRRLGLMVAVDDFGTGYSSLGYLKRLPIDVVKLDSSFIRGIPHDERDISLARLFLGITNQFSLISVAEGVETEEQAAWLLEHGCMIGQGFLFSKPVPIGQLIARFDEARAVVL